MFDVTANQASEKILKKKNSDYGAKLLDYANDAAIATSVDRSLIF